MQELFFQSVLVIAMIDLDDSNFDETLRQNRVVIIDFWAPWCGPCRITSPIFERLARKYEGSMIFGRVNVDTAPKTSQKFSIMSIPTVLLFVNKTPKDSIVGAVPETMLEQLIQKV